jgi:hypothetical protein
MLEKALQIIQPTKTKSAPSPFLEAWRNHPSGYPRLAERIAVKPETGIYRRFDALNARRILYLQAELCAIEKDLQLQEKNDNRDPRGHRSDFASDYESMLEAMEDNPQLDLVKKMQDKLEQYSECSHQCLPWLSASILTTTPEKTMQSSKCPFFTRSKHRIASIFMTSRCSSKAMKWARRG